MKLLLMKKQYKKNVAELKMNIRRMLSVKDTTMTNDKLQVGLDYIEESFNKLKAAEEKCNEHFSDILKKGDEAEEFIKDKIKRE